MVVLQFVPLEEETGDFILGHYLGQQGQSGVGEEVVRQFEEDDSAVGPHLKQNVGRQVVHLEVVDDQEVDILGEWLCLAVFLVVAVCLGEEVGGHFEGRVGVGSDGLGAETGIFEDILGEVGSKSREMGDEEGLDVFHLLGGVWLVLPPETVGPVVEEGFDVLDGIQRSLVALAHLSNLYMIIFRGPVAPAAGSG